MPTEAGIANDSSKAIGRRFRTIFHSQVQFIGLLSLDGTLLEAKIGSETELRVRLAGNRCGSKRRALRWTGNSSGSISRSARFLATMVASNT